MRKLVTAVLRNALRWPFPGTVWYEPLIPTLYVTPLCNLRCSYCEDFGVERNAEHRSSVLPTESIARLVSMLAEKMSVLYITGGEPLLRPDLVEILRYARASGIGHLAMSTNGLLLRENEKVLDHLDSLVISLDSLEEGRLDPVLARDPGKVRELIEAIRWAAAEQSRRGFTLTVTTVVSPGRVELARRVMEFCFEIGAEFSSQHLSVARLPSAELAADPEYRQFLEDLIRLKRAGRPISGSEIYFRQLLVRRPYTCAPTLMPHVDWFGRLAFPCRELPSHVLVDMLEAGSFEAALAEGARRFGPPPSSCDRCGERCYVEVSTLVRKPWLMAGEGISYYRQAAARRRAAKLQSTRTTATASP